MDEILTIFSSEDKQELKEAFKKIIIEQFKQDLLSNDEYLIHPDEIKEMVEEVLNEILDDVKALMEEQIEKELENLDVFKLIINRK